LFLVKSNTVTTCLDSGRTPASLHVTTCLFEDVNTCLHHRIASHKICVCNRFKFYTSQRISGMFSKTIPAFLSFLKKQKAVDVAKTEADFT
jgi:hypothetical protein